jgi:hypothetical protein
MRALVIATSMMVAACGDNLSVPIVVDSSLPDAPPTAAEYFGLRLGAHWTYETSGGKQIDKRITSCEEVVTSCGLPTGSTAWVYVRETRVAGQLRKVHYLRYVPHIGVVRVREDDSSTGVRTWEPFEIRVVDGPYIQGMGRPFFMRECEMGGVSEFTLTETVLDVEPIDTLGTTYGAQRIQHDRDGRQTQWSWYVRGIGEVKELDADGSSETLTAFEPGFADCPTATSP